MSVLPLLPGEALMKHIHRTRGRRGAWRGLACASLASASLLLVPLTPRSAAGQDGFLFRPPQGGITLRAGPMLYSARSDLFDALRQDLTLDRGDFRAPSFTFEVVVSELPRFDVVLGAGAAWAAARSEFREWVDQDGEAIEQRTTLLSLPVTVSVRYLLLERGRSVSNVAWLPRSTTPYVGVGGGGAWYRLRQTGEFVDFRDYRIFSDTLEASGVHALAHALLGVDHWFTPHVGLNAEARYTVGGADPGQGFHTFDSLDLGGLQATLGFSFRW
jgi:hypothetical protein